jgi:adenosine kinase
MAVKQVLGIGNPLLDISVAVDQAYLTKWGKQIGQATLASEADLGMFKEIQTLPNVQYIAGGAAQNTIRGAQWVSPTSGITHYIGCVGNDENGKRIKEAAGSDGVNTHYYVSKTHRTGSCAVLVHDKERSLCADLAAANDYQHSHFESSEIQDLVKKIDIVYTTGFFLTVSPQTLIELGQHCLTHKKTFVFSVAAVFPIEFYWDNMQKVLSYANIIVANESEATAFLKKSGLDNSSLKAATKLIANFANPNGIKRKVIITQGPDPVYTYDAETDEIQEWAVLPIKKEEIVDLNGAGDAFMGGFIAALAHNKPLAKCMETANACAHQILQVPGTQYPKTCNHNLNA